MQYASANDSDVRAHLCCVSSPPLIMGQCIAVISTEKESMHLQMTTNATVGYVHLSVHMACIGGVGRDGVFR